MNSEELTAAALSLPREERARLADELIRSLDEDGITAEAAWTQEVVRRAREIADGTVAPIDWEVARERIARRLEERRREASATSRR